MIDYPSTPSDAVGNQAVSVVIPTYYRNDSLSEALESVFRQEYAPIEVIVVDDSAEAHAAPIADSDDRVTYVPLDENRGQYAAREVGIQRSRGRYIQLLDDDDRLLPGKFDAQVPILQSNPDIGVVYCGLQWDGGPTVRPDPTVQGSVVEDTLRFSTSPAMMGTMLIERSVLEDLLPFRHRHGADDIGTKIELARRTKFDYVDEVFLKRGNSQESVGTSWAAVKGRHRIIEAYDDLYAEYPQARREALAETYLVSGQFRLNDRRWSAAALADFARALYHAPGFPLVYFGSFVSALFGRRVYQTVRSYYSAVVLGDGRTGKAT